MSDIKKKLSILVPMYNEVEVLPVFFAKISDVLQSIALDYEIICVNDGSTDDTLAWLKAKAATDSRLKIISFSRNFGKEPAMSAAVDFATGDAAIPIDVDLQDPPELIQDMVAKWFEGYDVVYAKRVSRLSDGVIKRQTAGWFYKVFNRISHTNIPDNVGDYRLLDRKVLDVLKTLTEKDRFMKGLFCWPGFRDTAVEFVRQERAEGKTKFNFWKLWNFALSGITSFSTMPIRLGVYIGMLIAGSSLVYGLFILGRTLYLGRDVPGYASLMVVILFLGGVQLLFLGLLGEYIGRIYIESKNRPLYVISEKIGFDDTA